MPTATPIPAARPTDATTDRSVYGPSIRKPVPRQHRQIQPVHDHADRQPIRKPTTAPFTARLFPDPTDNCDTAVPKNSTPANSGILQMSTTAIPSKPNAKWGTIRKNAEMSLNAGGC